MSIESDTRATPKKGDWRALQDRTKAFALQIIAVYCSLPKTTEAQVLGRQLLKSGTSVGAQHREASRARSKAECVSKIESALQELEETAYWLDLLTQSKISHGGRLIDLRREAEELIAILVASAKRVK